MVESEVVSHAATVLDSCPACGNVYMADAMFCRRCGRKRDDYEGENTIRPAAIWQWSNDGLSAGWGRKGAKAFRFMDRDSSLGQSLGRWNVKRVASKHAEQIKKLYLKDIYHTFMDGSSTFVQFMLYGSVYVFFFILFAGCYMLISDSCDLGMEGKFVRAYYLSLQTMVTIGYGAPDPYFNNCWQGSLVLTAQSLVGYFLNALVIGSVFVRLTRPQCRANTILFSDKALIQESNGALNFVFQVCEAKSHDLVQAHVRCYCIRHDRKGDQAYQTLPLRLQQPDDEHGSAVLLTFPTKIIHRIDNWSPLSPAADELRRLRIRRKSDDVCTPKDTQSAAWAYHWPEVPQRQVDAEQGNRDTCVCEVCGSSFQSFELLRRHTEYNAVQDRLNGVPEELCHKAWTADDMRSWGWTLVEQRARPGAPRDEPSFAVGSVEPSRDDVKAFQAERFLEIVVLVEGIEATTSASLQARHSYLCPTDFVWDRDFAKCALPGVTGELCAVDMSRFNELVPWPPPSSQASAQKGSTVSRSPKGNRLVDIVSMGSLAVKQAVEDAMSPDMSDEVSNPEGEDASVRNMSPLLKKAVSGKQSGRSRSSSTTEPMTRLHL